MSTFRLEPNGVIYLYHWISHTRPFKFSTGLKIAASKWNKEKMRPRSPGYKYNGMNVSQELIRIESAFLEAWNYFRINGGLTTIKLKQKFKEELSSVPESIVTNDKPSFLDFFGQTVLQYKAANKNNWQGYTTTLNRLKSYFGTDKPEFDDIDTAFYIRFNEYLIGLDLSVNTISNQWKHIKAIMKKAQMLKFHNNTDYQFFKRHREETDTVYLSVDELQKIFDLKLNGYKDKARNYFLIGCYTGLRFIDWDKISKSIIKNGIAVVITEKTREKAFIPISSNVLRILNKYENGVLPRKPSPQRLNDYIKLVVKEAGIDDIVEARITKGDKKLVISKPKYAHCTTHTARRSFATIMVLNGVAPHLIMKITGHKTLSSFEKYIRFDELQASIQLRESEGFKDSFGEAFTWSERLQFDPEFRKERTKLLL